MHLQQLF
jgi:hypothetical protein